MGLKTVFWTLVLGLLCLAEAGMIGDQCDWSGSGLTRSDERGVTPVYLRCREGGVSWVYPRGALRLLFKPPLPAGETDFRVCVRVIRRPDPPDLFYSLQENYTEPVDRFPARLFVEGVRRLVPLYAPDDGDVRDLRCFRSRHGQAALYVEAEPEEGPKRRVATFKYEARSLERRHYDPATADCRPCSDEELELAFCTSDLVSRAVIVSQERDEALDATQLTWRLTKLLRATDTDYYRGSSEGAEGEAGAGGLAHTLVPRSCGAAAGGGEFVVLARRRLGRLWLHCAPRRAAWPPPTGRHCALTD